jgi:AcrR family transcriptional regulator
MTGSGDRDVEEILAVIEAMHADHAPDPEEGLRERKKRRLRQRISDVATALFMVHGFDKVTAARIAAACEVSEQTLFNYFPTKESMLLDRSESRISAVADAVRERGSVSLVDSVVQSLAGGIPADKRGGMDEASQLNLFRRFCDVVTGSSTLAGARFADFAQFIDEVSAALAARVGADPSDPEVQLATLVIAGLVRVRQQSTFTHVHHATSLAALNDTVRRDLLRASQLAEPTLTAFDNTRQTRTAGRQDTPAAYTPSP